jgi:hypothetical protein
MLTIAPGVITSLHLRELIKMYQYNPGTVPRHEEKLNNIIPQKAFPLSETSTTKY